jgi:two-component system sensor histidine kinase KdpD
VRKELAGDIAAESERLDRMVDDLLVLARAERGVDLTAHGAALVQHRLRAVVASLAAAWTDRRFSCEIPEGAPPVTGDEAYLEHVLRNLLGNAAKYGKCDVTARVTVRSDTVTVTVLDDGPGVDPDQQERIFELFTRAKATSRLPGAGIGLFVVRRLVEAMGGRVTVANRPEGGAVFTVTLPRYVEPAES